MTALLYVALQNAILVTMLALLAAAAGRILHRPALIHAMWTLVLLKLLVPPLVAIPIHVGTSSRADASPGNAEIHSIVPARESSPGMESSPSSQVSLSEPSKGVELSRDAGGYGLNPAVSAERSLGWQVWALWISLAGSMLYFVRSGADILRFRRLLSWAEPACGELVDQVEACASQVGLARPPQVLLLHAVVSPMAWAVGRRAWLILPQHLVQELDREQLATVLTHELAHVRRGDHWIRLLELVVTGLYWWHPVVWWARRELRRAEEEACDAWVVSVSPGIGPTYAAALVRTVDFLASARGSLSPLVSGMARTTHLKRRLVMIVQERTSRVAPRRSLLVLLLLAITFLPFTFVLAQPPKLPSLDEIRATLNQRHTNVQSLYVEATSKSTSPFTLEEIRRLPGYAWVSDAKCEYHFACAGPKHYSRIIKHDVTTPDGTVWRLEDHTRACNGTTVWDDRDYEIVYPDGRVDKPAGRKVLVIGNPKGSMHFVYDAAYQAMNLGVAVAGPNLANADRWQDLFYLDFPSLQERWNLTVADKAEEVDGAPCAVLRGTIDMTYTKDGQSHQQARPVALWLDLQRGLALRKWEEARSQEIVRVVASQLQEVQPGLWLPHRFAVEITAAADAERLPAAYRGKPLVSTDVRINKLAVNEVKNDLFEPHSIPGATALWAPDHGMPLKELPLPLPANR